ncbi:hypothetical protein AB0H83_33300 [Dactylosporangium sp. NPDC050688]|uniref:hypothetical protein n=1 Tax=Dactylosporangium sp. NPDC050688 TaxID=3157217 RepID=UPI0033D8937E
MKEPGEAGTVDELTANGVEFMRYEQFVHDPKIRAYAAALAAAQPGTASPAELLATADGHPTLVHDLPTWIAWMQLYADHLDPLLPMPAAPEPPSGPEPEDLRPFLDGWSPYAPTDAPEPRPPGTLPGG